MTARDNDSILDRFAQQLDEQSEDIRLNLEEVRNLLSDFLNDQKVTEGLEALSDHFKNEIKNQRIKLDSGYKKYTELYDKANELTSTSDHLVETVKDLSTWPRSNFIELSVILSRMRKRGFQALSIPLAFRGLDNYEQLGIQGRRACVTSGCAALRDIGQSRTGLNLLREVIHQENGGTEFSLRLAISILTEHPDLQVDKKEVSRYRQIMEVKGWTKAELDQTQRHPVVVAPHPDLFSHIQQQGKRIQFKGGHQ